MTGYGSNNNITRSIAAYWSQFYLGNGKLYCYGVDDPASLSISGAHAFVVLGYELKNGEMTEELKGRCDAAAMAAQAAEAGLVAEAGPVVDGIDAIITGFPRYFL